MLAHSETKASIVGTVRMEGELKAEERESHGVGGVSSSAEAVEIMARAMTAE